VRSDSAAIDQRKTRLMKRNAFDLSSLHSRSFSGGAANSV